VTKRVLVVGESPYDASVIATFARLLCPGWICEPRRDAPLFAKAGEERRILSEAQRIAELWKQENNRRTVDGVVVHEDTDAAEPSHSEVASRIEAALESAECPGVAAVAAWETEAWFFMWPEAIEATKSAWLVPGSLRGKSTGHIQDPKSMLRSRCLRPGAKQRLRYQEKDAPDVAAQIAKRFGQRSGTSQSFDRFAEKLADLG
jgi:hypothetical protein